MEISFRGKRVFITGGAGFIGSHLAESLVKLNAEVTVYDNFSSGLRENLASIKNDIAVVEGDILDYDSLVRAMKGHHLISHQAAQLEITKCVDDPVDDLTSNTIGTLNVLNAAVKNNMEKVVSASSACVYGQPQFTPSDESNHSTNPNWAYGVSKLAAEKYCQIFMDLHKIPTVSFRYAIVYGEREWYGRVLTIFLKRLLEGRNPVVFGRGEQLRDFTYVGDLVRLHNLALSTPKADGEVFNVSTAIGTSIDQLAHKAVELLGAGQKVEYEEIKPGERSDKVDGRLRLPSELSAMVLDNQKAGKLLGWQPKITLEEGLGREYDWLRQHPERWQEMSY